MEERNIKFMQRISIASLTPVSEWIGIRGRLEVQNADCPSAGA